MDSVTSIFSNLDWEILLDLLLGISLSAASGFRVFIPLLVMSVAAVIGHIDLPPDFDWIETNQALLVFAIASAAEIAGYYIPFVDHFLDIILTPAAIVAGTLITASILPDTNPLLQWTIAVIAGGGTAGLTKGMTNIVRAISLAISAGLTNPVVATIELVLAITIAVLAITVPLLAGILVIVGLLLAARRIRKFLIQNPSLANAPVTDTPVGNAPDEVPQ